MVLKNDGEMTKLLPHGKGEILNTIFIYLWESDMDIE